MNSHKLSAVPIVNDAGVLVGTLSVSDLKSMTSDSFRALSMSTLHFAEKHAYSTSQIVCAIQHE